MSIALAEQVNNGVAILSRVLEPESVPMTPDAARTLMSFKFSVRDERRMNRLAAKARQGTLTPAEQAEAEQYNLVSHMLALLQAKARGVLPQAGKPAVS